MVPADMLLLYALRDVTGTVPSVPLITASILSKKLAEGLHALVMDVKFSSAAFMQTRALLTDINPPLGRSAGNWLEVKESIACLEGRGPADLQQLVLECAAALLVQTGEVPDLDQAPPTPPPASLPERRAKNGMNSSSPKARTSKPSAANSRWITPRPSSWN